MEADSEDMQMNDKGVEKLMDEYLKSKGFYRKKIAKDGSCLFRAVAEQVLHCQSRHTEVRATCVDYLKKNRTKYESFIEGNFEEYLHRLEDPQNWVGEVEISALALIYRHDFIIFQEPGKPPVNITENNYTDKVRLCFLNGNHYDSVYPVEFIKTAALCQSILYELLYERVYRVDHNVVAAACLARHGNPEDGGYGECKSSEESDLEDDEDFWPNEAAVPSNMNSRRIPNSNQTCKTAKSHPSRFSLSQRVQMSLNPSFFRNVEYDVWLRSQRVQQKRDFCMAAGMQYSVGDKCKVRLDNTGRFYSAYIQAVDPENGPVTVFIEELGKKHTIPLWDLRPSSGDSESWSTVAERGKKFSLVNGNGHHSERETRGGRKPGKALQSPHAPPAAAAGRMQKQHPWPPQATVDEHATGRTLHATARKGEPGTSAAPVQEPHFGLSPDERLAREEEEKSQALLEIMQRDEKSFPALGSQGVSRPVTQTGDGGKRSQNSERRGSKKKADPQPQEASGDGEAKDLAIRSSHRAEQTKLSGKCAGQLERRSPSADHNQAVQRHVPTKEDSARSGSSLGPQSAERGPPPEPSRAAAPTSAPAPAPAPPTPASTVSAPASAASTSALSVPAPSASTQTGPSTTPATSTTPAPSTLTPSAVPAPTNPAPSTAATSTAAAPSTTPALPPPASAASVPPPPVPAAASSAPTPPAHTSAAPAAAPAPPLPAPSLAPATPSPVSVTPAVPPPLVPNHHHHHHHPLPQQQTPAPPAGFLSAPLSGDASPFERPNSNPRGVMPQLTIAPAPPTPPVLPEHMSNHHAPSPSAPPPGPLHFHQISHLYQDPLYPGFPLNDKDEPAPTPQLSLMRNGQDLPKEMGVLRFFFNLGVKAYLNPMWPPHTYIYPLLQAHMSACAMQPKLPSPAPYMTSWYSETPPPGPVLRMSSVPGGAVTMQEGYGHAPAYGHAPPPGGRPPGQFEHIPCPVPPGVGVGMGLVGGALAPQHADLGLGSEGRPAMGYSPQPAAATLPPVMGGVPWPGPRPNTFPGAFPARPPPPPAQYLPPPQFPPVTLGYPAPRMSGGIPNIAPHVKSSEAPVGRGVGQTLAERPPGVPSTDPENESGKEKRVATPLTGPPRPASVPREQAPPMADQVTAGSGEAKGKARPVYVVVSTPDTGPPTVPPTQRIKVSLKEEPGSAEVCQTPANENSGEDGTTAPGGGPKEGEPQTVEPSSEPQVYPVWEEEGEPGETALRGSRSYYRSYRGRRGYDDSRGYRDTRWRGEGRGYRGRRGPDDRREYPYRERRSGESSPAYPGANMKGPNVRGRGRGYSPYPPGRESGYTVVYQRSNTYADS
ncbi:OTU domain-containing protein 4 [Megalops cyprinoides]|uniref:OTU domain-containing protein 4 n=1 Tax=Megalops cyprinoides TaxID=118141 RepID=UPI001863E2AF|nr:OTU domain-containing protein 4 [Megalops cyprinoides]